MYAIIGANGYLGSYLIKSIVATTSDNIIAAARNIDEIKCSSRIKPVMCDITNSADVETLAQIIKHGEPCKLIYLAAYHNLDLVAQNPKIAWNINITALASFLNTIDNLSCFYFSSTDCVYGEGKPDYRFKESDPLNPISLYGIHKAAAECLVRARGYNVLRLPYMFGPSLSPQKTHFYDKIVQNFRQGEKVEMFYDSLRSTLDYGTVADLTVRLSENYSKDIIPKTLNLCGDDCLSKYDLGLMLAGKMGFQKELVMPVSSENFSCVPLAKRAFAGLMDNTLLKNTLGLSEIKAAL